MKKILVLLLLSVVFFVSGCAVKVRQYYSTDENSQYLKSLNTKINVNKFTAKDSTSSVLCRITNQVQTPNDEPFETYIENALISELKKAGVYSKTSPIIISGYLSGFDVSSGITEGYWTFHIDVSANNNKGFSIVYKRKYSSNFMGVIACQDSMPNAFSPTVRGLIRKIIHHPEFKNIVKL